jgi:hypothetical protein
VGAIDFHHHGYPEISFDARTRVDDVAELTCAREAGMAAIVLKSHMWPTVGRAYHLKRIVPGIDVVPSITLNHAVGGFDPLVIEAAARQGARVVFMPTWSAAHDRERGGMSKYLATFLRRAGTLKSDAGLRVTGADGKLRSDVAECLAVAREFRMAVCTGHIAPRESVVLASAARDIGIEAVVFSHPDSHSVGATRDDIREMVRLGAVCEFCVLGMLPAFQRLHPNAAIDIIREIGAERCIITTDYFFEWSPPAPESLRMLIGTFLDLGLPANDISVMVRDNPARLLRWAQQETAQVDNE